MPQRHLPSLEILHRQRLVVICGLGLLLIGATVLGRNRLTGLLARREGTQPAPTDERHRLRSLGEFSSGGLLLRRGNNQQAAAEFRKLLEAHPSSAAAHYGLGVALSRLGQTTQAIEELGKAAQMQPDSADAYFALGVLLEELGETQNAPIKGNTLLRAVKHLKRAAALHPQEALAWFKLGRAYHQLQMSNEAVQSLHQALKLDAGPAEFWRELGHVYVERGNLPLAEVPLRTALQANPKDANTAYLLGMLYKKRGGTPQNAQRAIDCFRQALRLSANNPYYHAELGLMYLRLRQIRPALMELETAVAIDPYNIAAHAELARTYRALDVLRAADEHQKVADELGQAYNEARRYEIRVALNPNDAEAHYRLGIAYRNLGRFRHARSELATSLLLNPRHQQADRALRALLPGREPGPGLLQPLVTAGTPPPAPSRGGGK